MTSPKTSPSRTGRSVVPLRKGYETPIPDPDLAPGTELPDYLKTL